MATVLKTKSEQRLEQLEALKRPLTEAEGAELRRCLHAIYMKGWRVEREMNAAAMAEHNVDPDIVVKAEIEGIAHRMESAFDVGWPDVCTSDDWQEDARLASDMLCYAIQRAGVRP